MSRCTGSAPGSITGPVWLLAVEPLKLLCSIEILSLDSWLPGSLLVSEEVLSELFSDFDSGRARRARRFSELRRGDLPIIGRIPVASDPGGRSDSTFRQGVDKSKMRFLDQYLAWALRIQNEAADIAIVCDGNRSHQRFAMKALAELGRGRVAHCFDLWLDLFQREWLNLAELAQLCEITRKQDKSNIRLPGRIARHLAE